MFGLIIAGGVGLSAVATSALLIGLATGVLPHSIFGTREVIAVALRGLFAGGLAGGIFGALLSYRERRSTLSTLSSKRMALWGFVAGAIAPALVILTATGGALPLSILGAGVVAWGIGGALAGVGLLRLARRPSPERLPAHDESSQLLR